MTLSRQEEIISVLWIIASLLAFNGGYSVFGWIFAIKGFSDTVCAMYFSIKEALQEKRPSENAEKTTKTIIN